MLAATGDQPGGQLLALAIVAGLGEHIVEVAHRHRGEVGLAERARPEQPDNGHGQVRCDQPDVKMGVTGHVFAGGRLGMAQPRQ